MIVLITGGRTYDDVDTLTRVLDREHAIHHFRLLIHGCATGADTLSAIWAMKRGIHPAGVPALWDFYGRSEAGPVRNTVMLIVKPKLVIAFPGGRGTANMVEQAWQAGIRIIKAVDNRDLVGG